MLDLLPRGPPWDASAVPLRGEEKGIEYSNIHTHTHTHTHPSRSLSGAAVPFSLSPLPAAECGPGAFWSSPELCAGSPPHAAELPAAYAALAPVGGSKREREREREGGGGGGGRKG